MGKVSQIYKKKKKTHVNGENHAFWRSKGKLGDNETTDHCLITD